jgi:hypothetical protein
MMTIAAYTNIELSFDIEEDYDNLCQAKLLNSVIEAFAGEYENIKLLLAMQCDYILNANNIEAQLARMLTNVMDKLDAFTNLSIDLDNINKMMELISSQKK